MSIIYCDYCNHTAPAREWDGDFIDGESVCSQCLFDGMPDGILV